MAFNLLYSFGRFMAMRLPLRSSYAAALFLADVYCTLCAKERRAVIENLKAILGRPSCDKELEGIARDVFRNFAKYLVDFFRFSLIDGDYIKRYIKLDGVENLDAALKKGRGAIMLSAHLGNWELGGYVLGKLGYSMNAVVLTHKNEKVNKFFIDQRFMGNFKSIEIGASLRCCYRALKGNELLALLGDRNFSNTGLETEFFGKRALMPKGPAALSLRTGACIVPTYMVREADDTFRLIFEDPIYPESGPDEELAMERLIKRYLPSIENAIRQHPGQWYVFRDFWGNKDGKDKRPDTII